MLNNNEKLLIGRFGPPTGLLGWIKLHSFTQPPDNILDYPGWFVERQSGQRERLQMEEATQAVGQLLRVKLQGYEHVDAVRDLVGQLVYIERSVLPVLPEQEIYWVDLIGLAVINQQGIELGCIESMMGTGSHDVMIVVGERRRLIPYTKAVIQKVDKANGQVLVDWGVDY